MKAILVILFCILTYACALTGHTWNILLYIESSDRLSHAAIKNITDIVRGYKEGACPEIHIYIQVHCLPHTQEQFGNEAYRYKVDNHGLTVESIISLSGDIEHDIVDAARWAFYFPADYTMLVLWGHGFGILDPHSYTTQQGVQWHPEEDDLNHQYHHKALMLQAQPATYMTLSQMNTALQTITSELLSGRKLDIIGLDMCMMAMIEVGWELAPYAMYLVGSQDCEREYGWDYYAFLKHFGSISADPYTVAESIITTYADFYSRHTPEGAYTHAALNMRYLPELKDNLDAICQYIFLYHTIEPELLNMIKKIRLQLPRICCIPMYADLYTVYDYFEKLLLRFAQSDIVDVLREKLFRGKELIKCAVIACCTSKNRHYAHGLSIYFPLSHIDSSYSRAQFARESHWTRFIHAIVTTKISAYPLRTISLC